MGRQFKFDASLVSLFSRVLNENVGEVVRQVAGKIATGAEDCTPVKSGNAKGSWQVGVAAADLTTGIGSNSGNAQKLRQIQGDLPVFVTNNVAYAGRLEKGYSKKAPNGMLRAAVDSVTAQINAIVDAAREKN